MQPWPRSEKSLNFMTSSLSLSCYILTCRVSVRVDLRITHDAISKFNGFLSYLKLLDACLMEESNFTTDTSEILETLLQSVKGRISHRCQHEESKLNWTFCKPKLLPLKTFTIEKLEKLQKEAEEKLMNSNLSSE